MSKLNKKGFALAETLIVSVFVMEIFTIIFLNFFPMMGEYERRQNYDDVDSIYKTYLIKKMFESEYFSRRELFLHLGEFIRPIINGQEPQNIYNSFDKSHFDELCGISMRGERIDYCKNLMTETGATKIVFTKYNLTDLKNYIKTNDKLGSKTIDYVSTLPYYKNQENNPKQYQYRIIVMYERSINSEDDTSTKTITSFSTMGVEVND